METPVKHRRNKNFILPTDYSFLKSQQTSASKPDFASRMLPCLTNILDSSLRTESRIKNASKISKTKPFRAKSRKFTRKATVQPSLTKTLKEKESPVVVKRHFTVAKVKQRKRTLSKRETDPALQEYLSFIRENRRTEQKMRSMREEMQPASFRSLATNILLENAPEFIKFKKKQRPAKGLFFLGKVSPNIEQTHKVAKLLTEDKNLRSGKFKNNIYTRSLFSLLPKDCRKVLLKKQCLG